MKNSYSQSHSEITKNSHELQRPNVNKYTKLKESSNLKKKVKKNNYFREVQEPIDYDTLKKRFIKMEKEDEQQVHQTQEQIYLLNYKSSKFLFNKLNKENKGVHEEIQLCNRKSEMSINHKPMHS